MFSEVRWMRLFVLYDLPVTTDEYRRAYQRFHKFLIKDGYDMLQYSIYCRLCNGHDAIDKHIKRIEYNTPSKGNVRIIKIT